MIYPILASVLFAAAIVLLLRLTPEQVTEDLLSMLSPKDSLKTRSRNLRGNKTRHRLYNALIKFRYTLMNTGKAGQFTVVCFASLFLFGAGLILSVILGNLFLTPVISAAFALIPFLYSSYTVSLYEKHINKEMETALSVITNSYLRSEDILLAVKENLQYIKPPLNKVFKEFLGEATAVSSDLKSSLEHMKAKVKNSIFSEWIDALIRCQSDRTLKDTLRPIVDKLTDVRIVNNELKTLLSSTRNEYYTMVLLVLGNIPLLYLLNKDWFETLLFTTSGKAVLGFSGTVMLVTFLLMLKFTKPIAYKR